MKMTIGSRKRIFLPIIAAVFASLAVVIWLVVIVWFASPNPDTSKGRFISFQMQTYSSVEDLSNASDTVVIGTVKGIVGHEINHEINEVYYEINVTKILKGETAETIIVASPDMNQTICDEVTPLRAGEEVLLFLTERTKGEAPDLELYEHFYVTVSLDNGVFDVLNNNTVQPRYAEAFVGPNEDGTFEPPTYNLTEVCEKIRSVN